MGPYTELFEDVLPRLVRCGYLEAYPARNEVYVTRAALAVLAINPDDAARMKSALHALVAWCMWLRAASEGFKLYVADAEQTPTELESEEKVQQSIETLQRRGIDIAHRLRNGACAVHIVGDDAPYPLIATALLEWKRRWWWPFKRKEVWEMVGYN